MKASLAGVTLMLLSTIGGGCSEGTREDSAAAVSREMGGVARPSSGPNAGALLEPENRPAPFGPSEVYQGEGPPFARLVLRPEGPLWRVSLFGGSDPRPGGPGAADCHVEAEGPRRGDKIKARFIPVDRSSAEDLSKEPRWVDVELKGQAAWLSTDVFGRCGLGANFDGRYRKLPAVSKAAGEERVRGLTGAWRVVEVLRWGPPHPFLRDDSQDTIGATLEITPEHIAWVRFGAGGESDWEAYCADPRLSPAPRRADTVVKQALSASPSTASVAISHVWEIKCSERIGFGTEAERTLVLLADGRLSLRTDDGTSAEHKELTVLKPVRPGP